MLDVHRAAVLSHENNEQAELAREPNDHEILGTNNYRLELKV